MFQTRNSELSRLISKEDWGLARMVCSPKTASVWSEQKNFFDGKHSTKILPLHQACALQPSQEIIQALVLAFPDALKLPDSVFGRLPLHVACRSGASYEVIEMLLLYFPNAARMGDALGRVPIHYALSHGAPPNVIRLLVKDDEDDDGDESSVRTKDGYGWLPIHVACCSGATPETVKLLMELYPESIHVKTNAGSTPWALAKRGKGPNKTKENRKDIMEVLKSGLKDPFSDLLKDHLSRRRSSFRQLRKSSSLLETKELRRMSSSLLIQL